MDTSNTSSAIGKGLEFPTSSHDFPTETPTVCSCSYFSRPDRESFKLFQGNKKKSHAAEYFASFYNKLKGKGKFGGIYFFVKPVVLLTDLDFVKNVMIKVNLAKYC